MALVVPLNGGRHKEKRRETTCRFFLTGQRQTQPCPAVSQKAVGVTRPRGEVRPAPMLVLETASQVSETTGQSKALWGYSDVGRASSRKRAGGGPWSTMETLWQNGWNGG